MTFLNRDQLHAELSKYIAIAGEWHPEADTETLQVITSHLIAIDTAAAMRAAKEELSMAVKLLSDIQNQTHP